MSTQAVLTSPSFTFTQWHTLPCWELPCPTRLLSSSTGADGIKGKGLLNNCCPFLCFCIQSRYNEIMPCRHRFRATREAALQFSLSTKVLSRLAGLSSITNVVFRSYLTIGLIVMYSDVNTDIGALLHSCMCLLSMVFKGQLKNVLNTQKK